MGTFTTAFEITTGTNGLRTQASIYIAIGVVGLLVGIGAVVRQCRKERRVTKQLFGTFAFLAVWSVGWFCGTLLLVHTAFSDVDRLLAIHRNGKSEVVEGTVHVLHQQPAGGHARGDQITVGGREFEVDYFRVTPGYNQTIAHEGVLREGAAVRLHHDHGVILQVEVASK